MPTALLSLLLVCAGTLPTTTPTTVVVGPKASSAEQLAVTDLVRCLYEMTGRVPHTGTSGAKGSELTIVVGCPDTNPTIAGMVRAGALALDSERLGDEGHVVAYQAGARTLALAGSTPVAAAHAVYTFLEEQGCGFLLGGDSIPRNRGLRVDGLSIMRVPALAVRGSLPWYNFFDSPTAWNLEDHRSFIDQMAKMKMNFIGFHSYDSEPFCAYRSGQGYIGGEPLLTSLTPTWGTRSLPIDSFAFGTGALFEEPFGFGSRAAIVAERAPDKRDASIEAAQGVLQQAFGYARMRGLKTCIGFETGGDPMDPAQEAAFIARLTAVAETYPMVDAIWLWEPEAMGVNGCGVPAPDSPFGAALRQYERYFAYLAEPQRRAEGVRLAVYGLKAHAVLARIVPHARLVLSGWGGDNWLHWTDFMPGLHQILPRDVVFSALDNIAATPTVSAHYATVASERECWPIPWYEYDGDQWFAQPNMETFVNATKDAIAKRARGVLAIHWRTRGVEESAYAMSQVAWDPRLTYDGVRRKMAERMFGERYASFLSRQLGELQRLGYRWVGPGGQSECGGFGWGPPGLPKNRAVLANVRQNLEAVRNAVAEQRPAGGERIDWLISHIDWALAFDTTVSLMSPAGAVGGALRQAEEATAAGRTREAGSIARSGLLALERAPFPRALQACAESVSSRGELGTLATINAKAYTDLRETASRLASYLPNPPASAYPGEGEMPGPRIVVARRPTLIPAGYPLRVSAAVLGRDMAATLRYRALGGEWRELPMKPVARAMHEAVLAADEVRSPGLEFRIVASGSGGTAAAWPTEGTWCVGVSPDVPPAVFTLPSVVGPDGVRLERCVVTDDAPEPYSIAVKSACFRQGQTSAEPNFLDHPVCGARSYFERPVPEDAVAIGWVAQPGDAETIQTEVLYPLPAAPAPPASLAARPLPHRAVDLQWAEPTPTLVADYEVHRSATPGFIPAPRTLIGRTLLPRWEDSSPAFGSSAEYCVVAIGANGERVPSRVTVSLGRDSFPPVPAPTGLVARPRPGGVVLTWDRPALGTRECRLERSESRDSGFAEVRSLLTVAPPPGTDKTVVLDTSTAPRWYRIVAVAKDGTPSTPSEAVAAGALPGPIAPAVTFHPGKGLEGVQCVGSARLVDGPNGKVLEVASGGHAVIADRPELSGETGLTIRTRVRVDDTSAMPVLLSHGTWLGDGWFLQSLGGRYRFHIASVGTVDAGDVTPKTWRTITCTYDGSELRTYVDGRLVGTAQATGRPKVQPRNLLIGRYELAGPEYETKGAFEYVEIYDFGLSDEEVKARDAGGR